MSSTTVKFSPRRLSRRPAQSGYLMLELALVLAISTILMASQFSQITRGLQEAMAKSTGQYLVEMQGAVNKYIGENFAALRGGQPVTGFVRPLEPTTAELIAANFAPEGFEVVSPIGLSFATKLELVDCPTKCAVTGTTYATTPYTVSGALRNDILAVAVEQMGLHGRVSRSETPAILSGTVETSVNPLGPVAGILAIRVGAGTASAGNMDDYYRVDGTKPLTGPMDAGNQDITNVRSLTTDSLITNVTIATPAAVISGTATPGAACLPAQQGEVRRNTSGTGLAVCFNNVWQMVGNVVPGIAEGGACSTSGLVGASAIGVSFICNGSTWTSVDATATPGSACAPNGRVALSNVNREQLVCTKGAFIGLASLLPRSVEVSRLLVKDGDVITKPTCPGAVGTVTPSYSFHLQQTVVDVSVSPPRQALALSTVDNGPTWSVLIKLKTNTGTTYSGNTYSVTAVMKLECTY